MTCKPVARISQDQAGSTFVSTGRTNPKKVFVNGNEVVTQGSVTARGSVAITSSNSVFVDNKGVSREGDVVNRGAVISPGSQNVCAGD